MEGTAQGQREKEARRNSQLLDEAYNDLIDANVHIGNLQRTLASLEREVRTLREDWGTDVNHWLEVLHKEGQHSFDARQLWP